MATTAVEPNRTMTMAKGMRTSAVKTRVRVIGTKDIRYFSAGRARRRSSFNPAIAAFAPLKIEEGLKQAGAVEVGPKDIRDKNLGVGDLPEQEIADSHFTAGSNEEVGVRKIGGVKMLSELLFGNGGRGAVAVPILTTALGEDVIHGINDLGTTAIV